MLIYASRQYVLSLRIHDLITVGCRQILANCNDAFTININICLKLIVRCYNDTVFDQYSHDFPPYKIEYKLFLL